MSGSANKRAGSSYEYRVKSWFESIGWSAKRIALSGAVESIGRHDVHAWDSNGIYLIVEAKKRTKVKDIKKRSEIEIKKEWIDNLRFEDDEILVFATDRSPHYCLIPKERFFLILNRRYDVAYDKDNSYQGEKQFLLKRECIDDTSEGRYHLKWNQQEYVALTLEDFVTLRATAKMEGTISTEQKIMRLINIEEAHKFELENIAKCTTQQKILFYQKLEQLESGGFIDPIAHADAQFWLGDRAFVCICPHCETSIYKADFKKSEPST